MRPLTYASLSLCCLASCGTSPATPPSRDSGTEATPATSPDARADAATRGDARRDAAAGACKTGPVVVPTSNFFVDVSASSHIQDQNFVPSPTTPIPINDHSRLAVADINGDGFDDIVMHNLFPDPQ